MKEQHEYLTEREIYVLENHPAMTYKAIGEKLGVSMERVRQIKVQAERKVKEEKRRERLEFSGRQTVMLQLERREVWLLRRSLQAYTHELLLRQADQRRKKDAPDADLAMAEFLAERLRMI